MIHLPTFTFDTALSIISVNVNGLRDRDKRAGFVQWLRSLPSPADVVCLQECHCVSVNEVSFWFPGSGLLCTVSPGSNHRVAALCYLDRLSLLFVRGLMTAAGFSSANAITVARFFVLLVCMRQIAIRSARSSMMMCVSGLTLPSSQFYVGTSMLCLIVCWIVLGRILPILFVELGGLGSPFFILLCDGRLALPASVFEQSHLVQVECPGFLSY